MPPNPARRFISASEFKARCLELMDEVSTTRAELIITKHGAAVARLVPMADSVASAFGFLRGTVRHELSLFDTEGVVAAAPSTRRPAMRRPATAERTLSKSVKPTGATRSK